jgi:hypothetical protein
MTGHIRGDVRKNQSGDHWTHHDPAVRELIAEAEARGRSQSIDQERLADAWDEGFRAYGDDVNPYRDDA